MKREITAIVIVCASALANNSVYAAPPSTGQNVLVTNTSASPVPVTAPVPLQVSASSALPVVVNNTSTSPVNVAVVNGAGAPQPVNGNGFASAVTAKYNNLVLYYNYTGHPALLTSVTVQASKHCEDGGPPIWVGFGVSAPDGASQAHVSAAYQAVGPQDLACVYIATSPGPIVVPHGQSLTVTSLLNLTTNGVQISAGFSGHTLH